MLCPKCHNNNAIENETCDFCMAKLPMSEKRANEIALKKKAANKAKFQKSRDKIIGMLLGLAFIALITILGIVIF